MSLPRVIFVSCAAPSQVAADSLSSSSRNRKPSCSIVNGVEKVKWSGMEDWDAVSFPVAAGTRTFEWTYSKDGSISRGYDTAWIDEIVFPLDNEELSDVDRYSEVEKLFIEN